MCRLAVDIADETFIVADSHALSQYFDDRRLWGEWWPRLELTVTAHRGDQGVQWSVSGELIGTAEVWLEPWHDGVIVHWFLRAQPRKIRSHRRVNSLRRRYEREYKRRINQCKDRWELDIR